MKKLTMLFLMVIAMTIQGQNQGDLNWGFGELSRISSSRMDREVPLGTYLFTESEKKQILEGQYLHKEYRSAKVDTFKTDAYLRFNLFNNQMEFSKDGNIYYLKKETGRKVRFKNTNTLYKVYDLFGDLKFLQVITQGKNTLLLKESMKFIAPRKNASTYGGITKPKFKKNKTEFYLQQSDGELKKIPLKNKTFFKAFGTDETKVKSFMKQEKLNYKNLDDLKKVIDYLNK